MLCDCSQSNDLQRQAHVSLTAICIGDANVSVSYACLFKLVIVFAGGYQSVHVSAVRS